MTTATRHFNRQPGAGWLDVTARRDAAYRAAGLTPPAEMAAVRELLDAVPTPESVAVALAIEAVTEAVQTSPAQWWRDARKRLEEAEHAAILRKAVAANVETVNRARAVRASTAAVRDLQPAFDAAVAQLTAAAAQLPEDPFDTEAIFKTDATRAHREAVHALGMLATIASIHEWRGSELPKVRAVLPVLDCTEVQAAEADRLTLNILNPDPTRDSITRFLHDMDTQGTDAALVNVARGAYGAHVRFTLAEHRVELSERGARFDTAAQRRFVDSWGYRPKAPTTAA